MIELFSKQTQGLYILIHIFYIFIVLYFWKSYAKEKKQSNKYHLFLFLFVIYVVFAFDGGDFYHYFLYIYFDDYHAFESVYQIIGQSLGNNYLAFRLVVWGGASVFTCITFKRFGLNIGRTLFFLFAVYISVFDYARATLAMSIYFLGISYLLIPHGKLKIFSRIFGIALIIISTYFHRSLVIAALMTFMIFMPINKRTIIPMVVVFIASGTIMNSVLEVVVGTDIFSEEVSVKIEGYSEQEYDDHFSTYEWIRRYMEYATFYIPMVIITIKLFYSKTVVKASKEIKQLYKITLGLIFLATGTVLTDDLTFVLFYRFLYMAFIPITIIFCYLEQKKIISNRTYIWILYVGIVCKLFGFAKRIAGGRLN